MATCWPDDSGPVAKKGLGSLLSVEGTSVGNLQSARLIAGSGNTCSPVPKVELRTGSPFLDVAPSRYSMPVNPRVTRALNAAPGPYSMSLNHRVTRALNAAAGPLLDVVEPSRDSRWTAAGPLLDVVEPSHDSSVGQQSRALNAAPATRRSRALSAPSRPLATPRATRRGVHPRARAV